MATIQEEIHKMLLDGENKLADSRRLEKMLQAFPDLQRYEGRWNKIAYYSATVNNQATDYDMRLNCGCCSDSPLEVWPFMETPNGKVYSDPPMFVVGEKHWMGGDKPNADWQKRLRDASIPESIIERIAAHFQADKEKRIQWAMEDDEVYLEEDERKM